MGDELVPEDYYAAGDNPPHENTVVVDAASTVKKRRRPKKSSQERIDLCSLSPKDACSYIIKRFSSIFPETSDLELSTLKRIEQLFVRREGSSIAQHVEELIRSESILESRHCKVLIFASSAVRAMEILSLRKKCRIAKLFARHLKIQDQIKMLDTEKVPIAIGTPARIWSIMNGGSALDNVTHLIVDVSRDIKLRSILDIPETAKPMVEIICQKKFLQDARREKSISFAQ